MLICRKPTAMKTIEMMDPTKSSGTQCHNKANYVWLIFCDKHTKHDLSIAMDHLSQRNCENVDGTDPPISSSSSSSSSLSQCSQSQGDDTCIAKRVAFDLYHMNDPLQSKPWKITDDGMATATCANNPSHDTAIVNAN
ncbi:hypothetical protein RFI_14111, partial [Reticulomyxa filosa]